VRVAGRFKGDVNVQGNVTIEQGAHVTGQVTAATIIVSGEVHGNITATARVELLETGVINGDIKAAVLTVAAGSRMRGQADFGWTDQGPGAK
jgi:cytoskeletal protein CcmA (bactofilin family)